MSRVPQEVIERQTHLLGEFVKDRLDPTTEYMLILARREHGQLFLSFIANGSPEGRVEILRTLAETLAHGREQPIVKGGPA